MRADLMNNISESLLISLYGRALETKRKKPIIYDNKAVEITEELNKEMKFSKEKLLRNLAEGKISRKLLNTIALKTKIYDTFIKDFLERYPKSVIVNLDSSFSTKFYRCDNGKVIWYDFDLKNIIHIKRNFIPENDRFKYISGNITNFKWIYEVMRHRRKVMFIADGLFENFEKDDAIRIMVELADRFPECEFVCDLASEYLVGIINSNIYRKMEDKFNSRRNIKYKFGVKNSRDILKYSNKIELVKEWVYVSDTKPRVYVYIMRKLKKLIRTQWTALYSFKL